MNAFISAHISPFDNLSLCCQCVRYAHNRMSGKLSRTLDRPTKSHIVKRHTFLLAPARCSELHLAYEIHSSDILCNSRLCMIKSCVKCHHRYCKQMWHRVSNEQLIQAQPCESLSTAKNFSDSTDNPSKERPVKTKNSNLSSKATYDKHEIVHDKGVYDTHSSDKSLGKLVANEEIKENILTIPNLLTLSRIVATPVLGYMVLHEGFQWALGIFVCAGITDLLDGYIARNFKNQNSVLGSALDPLADKLLVSVLTLTLTAVDLIPVPLTSLIVGRDLALIGAAFYIRYISLPSPKTVSRYFDVTLVTAKLYPSMISKVNTALQLSLVAVTLAAPVFGYVSHPLLQGLWYMTAATTFLSGISYLISWRENVKIVGSPVKKP